MSDLSETIERLRGLMKKRAGECGIGRTLVSDQILSALPALLSALSEREAEVERLDRLCRENARLASTASGKLEMALAEVERMKFENDQLVAHNEDQTRLHGIITVLEADNKRLRTELREIADWGCNLDPIAPCFMREDGGKCLPCIARAALAAEEPERTCTEPCGQVGRARASARRCAFAQNRPGNCPCKCHPAKEPFAAEETDACTYEDCPDPATKRDVNGLPFCAGCYEALCDATADIEEPAPPKCATCGGHGVIFERVGNFRPPDARPCPDCSKGGDR